MSDSKSDYALVKSFKFSDGVERSIFEELVGGSKSATRAVGDLELKLIAAQEDLHDDEAQERLDSYRLAFNNLVQDRFDEILSLHAIHQRLKPLQPDGCFDGPYDAASAMMLHTVGGTFTVLKNQIRPGLELFSGRPGRYLFAEEGLPLEDRTQYRFFRGLKSTKYSNTPPLLRGEAGKRATSDEIKERLTDIEVFRTYLRRDQDLQDLIFQNADKDDVESLELALIQHFKDELGLMPPLLDWTLDPLVALFFASFGSVPGETGVIYCLDSFNASRMNDLLGTEVSFCALPSVMRIKEQRAGAIEYSQTDLVESCIPFTLTFRQTGECFKDPSLGISEQALLNNDPHLEEKFKRLDWKQDARPSVPPSVYDLDSGQEQRIEALFHKLKNYVNQKAKELGNEFANPTEDSIRRLATFHISAMAEPRIPIEFKSLGNLSSAIDKLCETGKLGPRDYYSWLTTSSDVGTQAFLALWRLHF